jgi:hypothetical protein
LVLVYGILSLLIWGRVLAAFQLHYMEVGQKKKTLYHQ